MRWEKWNTGWYRTVLWIMTKPRKATAFTQPSYRTALLENTNATCWTAAMLWHYRTQRQHKAALTASASPGSAEAAPPAESRSPRRTDGDYTSPGCHGKATVTISSLRPSLLGLNQQLRTSRSRSGVRWIQGKGQKSQRPNSHQRFPFPCSLNI